MKKINTFDAPNEKKVFVFEYGSVNFTLVPYNIESVEAEAQAVFSLCQKLDFSSGGYNFTCVKSDMPYYSYFKDAFEEKKIELPENCAFAMREFRKKDDKLTEIVYDETIYVSFIKSEPGVH